MAGPDGLRAGQPVVLFEGDFAAEFDVSADGERFLLFRASDAEPSAVNRLELVQNWFEELKQLVPVE